MTVLVDTSVWSLALRRRPLALSSAEARIVDLWRDLIEHQRAALIGMIRQEILSGIKSATSVATLAAYLNDMPYLPTSVAEHDLAAEFYNHCQSRGISAGAIDMLICAASAQSKCAILTVDKDFDRYSKILPISLMAR